MKMKMKQYCTQHLLKDGRELCEASNSSMSSLFFASDFSLGNWVLHAAFSAKFEGEKKMVKIHNVFAVIRGQEEPDHYVLLGNHKDSWTYGAVDPNSGTAALLDIARRYALLMRSGWIPRRTIVLCSWDAKEFGMIGSTELSGLSKIFCIWVPKL